MQHLPKVTFSSEYASHYPELAFGLGAVWGCTSKATGKNIEKHRDELESMMRDRMPIIKSSIGHYDSFFKNHKYKCPLPGQFHNTCMKGLPRITPYVDSLLITEMCHGVLMGVQDLDKIQDQVLLDTSNAGEKFMGMRNTITCRDNDIVIRSGGDIIASYFQGPDSSTSVTKQSCNLLFYGFFAPGIDVSIVQSALDLAISLPAGNTECNTEVKIYSIHNHDSA